MVNAVAINVMVQCSETELDHYINANGIILVIFLSIGSIALDRKNYLLNKFTHRKQYLAPYFPSFFHLR